MNNSLNNDRDSKLGVYYSINSELKPYLADDIPEFEMVVITRYRYDSHDIKITKGFHEKTDREMCVCQQLQTLEHVVLECPHTSRIEGVNTLKKYFEKDRNIVFKFLNSLTSAIVTPFACMKVNDAIVTPFACRKVNDAIVTQFACRKLTDKVGGRDHHSGCMEYSWVLS